MEDKLIRNFNSHYTKGSQWTHPRTGRKKLVEGGNFAK